MFYLSFLSILFKKIIQANSYFFEITFYVGISKSISAENNFQDFDDQDNSNGIKANLEMYDYGEDFDCGDEENSKYDENNSYRDFNCKFFTYV